MAGAGFKTFNTGDVLTASDVNTYLMQQTTMVFADASARSTALGANVAEGMISYLKDTNAVERYDGSSWGAIGAGDIEGVTAGAGLSGGGTSGTVTLNLASTAAGRNFVINGGFDIWQRGTANTTTAGAYLADRWCKEASTHYGMSRQTTSDTTNLPNIQYAMRVQRTAGSTVTNNMAVGNSFENVNSTPLIGKTVTLSFYARAGANYSATSSTLYGQIYSGTGTDQNVTGTYTGITTVASKSATLTTTWQRFEVSGTVATSATELAVYFYGTPTGTAGANDWYEITGVQLELGSSATPFSRNGSSIQGELAACQRYWQQSYNAGTAGGTATVGGFQMSPQQNSIANGENTGAVTFPTTMRTAPTVSIWSYAGTSGRVSTGNAGGDLGANSGTVQNPSVRHFALYNNSGGTITTNSLQTVFHWTASAEL